MTPPDDAVLEAAAQIIAAWHEWQISEARMVCTKNPLAAKAIVHAAARQIDALRAAGKLPPCQTGG
ncbi:MAG: hypothetical protein KGI82_08905 [Betaproteobacteria bacterium]|nr:hypothetical protein [Betaproteobacteria bacterium]